MAAYFLPFEKPLLDLQNKIDELLQFSKTQGIETPQDVARLETELVEARRGIYAALTPWQKVMVARHPRRPYTRDYIAAFIKDFTELHGDRLLAEAVLATLRAGRPARILDLEDHLHNLPASAARTAAMRSQRAISSGERAYWV